MERQACDLHRAGVNGISSRKPALWQWRNRFMVIAQVPIVPRTTIEDSSRRIVQDEIEISVSGQLLLNSNSEFELAQRIWRQGAPLGELFSFISSLYFRGKLAYAKAGFPSTLVVTTSRSSPSPRRPSSRWTTCWKCPQFQSIRATLDIGSPFARMRARAGWRATDWFPDRATRQHR